MDAGTGGGPSPRAATGEQQLELAWAENQKQILAGGVIVGSIILCSGSAAECTKDKACCLP